MTNTTIRRAASAFIVLALALGAGACSDDEEGGDDTGTEEAATDEGTSSEDYTAEEMTSALESGFGFSAETSTCIVDEMFATFEQDRINEIAASEDAYATDEEYQGIVAECAEANGDPVPEPAAVEGEG